MDLALIYELLLALGLGFLVGFQREWAEKKVAGVRTYPLITALGVLSVVIAEAFGGWVVAAALLGVAAFLVVGDLAQLRKGEADPGITTEVSALVMFGVGCAIGLGHARLALIATGAVAVLLHWKAPIHGIVRRVGKNDLNAIIRLVLIAMVILPLLPNQSYGPFGVLNPFEIWLMVALIVDISLAAYIVYKLFGRTAGLILTGLLGGLISSTATAIAYARNARSNPGVELVSAVVIMLASTIVIVRVLFEIALVAPGFLAAAAPPLGALLGCMAVIAAVLTAIGLRRSAETLDVETPAALGPAVLFGALYAAVLLAVAFAKERFGESGIYAVAALSGLTDMDAITLSTAQLVRAEELDPSTAWRAIVVGTLANLAFKGAAVAVLGNLRLFVHVALAFAASAVAGAAIIALWP